MYKVQAQALVVLTLVGIFCGFVAWFVGSSSVWLKSARQGYCLIDFKLNKEQCCSLNSCKDWKPWVTDANPFLEIFLYVGTSTLLAGFSTILVTLFAPEYVDQSNHSIAYHSAGAVIPQVNHILGGCVFRGFLGIQSPVVKTLGCDLLFAFCLVAGR